MARELGRRWGDTVQVLLVEDPSPEVLEHWDITVLPTWLRFLPEPVADGDHPDARLVLPQLGGTDIERSPVCLEGPWRLEHRLTGAHPKHVIDAEFGPSR